MSVQDKEAVASGQSTAVHFDQTKAKNPQQAMTKTTTPNQNNQSTASTTTDGQQSDLASGTNGNANQQITRTTQGNTSQKQHLLRLLQVLTKIKTKALKC